MADTSMTTVQRIVRLRAALLVQQSDLEILSM